MASSSSRASSKLGELAGLSFFLVFLSGGMG
jgi:hypothetical protein